MTVIDLATEADIVPIRNVQRETWFATYPNGALGITRADIAAKFAHDDSHAGRPEWLQERKRQFHDARIAAWVARDEGAIVGYCVAKKETTQNRIQALYVLPSYQREGVGTKLMDTALVWLGKDKDICINVASYNEHAIAFYARFGFIQTGKSVADEVARLPTSKVIPEIEMVKSFHR